ncbi:hypothetical protein Z043_104798 [Scleropages formosus]|uniref:RILP-like protein 2 n=1 Tax=Scleropages formosus TaxID=113540 RepID=A0A0P7Z5K6_SCLFO|nr:hypothetical protein Z043_104798 [Scleropages formosus]
MRERVEQKDAEAREKIMESTLEKPVASLTVDDVYDVAKAIGAEVEKLIDSFGKEAVVGLVPKIVRVLELLESFAARSQSCTSKEEELLKAYETFQAQQQQQQQKKKKKAVKEADDDSVSKETRQDLQQKEDGWHRRSKELEAQVLQLQEQNQELMDQLRISTSQEDRAQRQEREVMLKLKAVVDKQRDEIRAKTLELSSLSKEVEAVRIPFMFCCTGALRAMRACSVHTHSDLEKMCPGLKSVCFFHP